MYGYIKLNKNTKETENLIQNFDFYHEILK